MVLSLLFFNNRGRTGSLAQIDFDAILSEVHSAESTVTRFPVENGVSITDHIVNEPKRLRIEGFVSNASLRSGGGSFSQRAQNAFNELFELRDDRALLSVVSDLKVYQNMAIVSINVPKDRGGATSVNFTVDLIQVTKANFISLLTPLNILPLGSIRDQAASMLGLGRQTVSSITQSVSSVASSAIRGFF